MQVRHKGAPRVFEKSKQKMGLSLLSGLRRGCAIPGHLAIAFKKRGCVCSYQKGFRHEGKKRGCLVRRAKQRGFHNRGGRGAGAAKGP